MKKTTKRAASVLLAAAMCMPAVTSAAAVEGVNYDDYECVKLELNDLEIPAYGNGEFGFCYDSNDYHNYYSYIYNSAELFSMMGGSVTWENSMLGTFTETFDDLAAYAEQHDLYPSVWNEVFYRKDGMDVTVHVGNAEDDVHISPVSTTQPLVTDFTVSDCEMAVGDEDVLIPNFSFTLADGTTVEVRLVGDEHGHFWMAADGRAYQEERPDIFKTVDLEEVRAHAQTRRAAYQEAQGRRLGPVKDPHAQPSALLYQRGLKGGAPHPQRKAVGIVVGIEQFRRLVAEGRASKFVFRIADLAAERLHGVVYPLVVGGYYYGV